MSALPPKADIAEGHWHVRFVVPKADIGMPGYRSPRRPTIAPLCHHVQMCTLDREFEIQGCSADNGDAALRWGAAPIKASVINLP